MKPDYCWTRVNSSLPNLNVLMVNGIEAGFIYKPKDSKSDKNAWRIHRGVGIGEKFLGWNWTKTGAQQMLEQIFLGNRA